MEDLFICGQIFGSRLVSEEKERELRAQDAEIHWFMSCMDDLQTRTRLPAISVICSCKEGPRPARPIESFSSSSSEEYSDSDSDDEGFTLKQVLNAIDLYERKPLDKRSPKTLRNLVCSYAGKENVEDEQVKKILELTRNEDPGLGEVAMLLTRQLCIHENNAFKFLYHEGMQHNVNILADKTLQNLHEGAAQVIGKLACHQALGDLWLDFMMTTGLAILTSCLGFGNPQNIQYACAQALSSLASHQNLAVLIIDQTTDAISQFKNINTDFRDVYAEIMTVLAQHTEHTRASILDVRSLPEAICMLKQGPCASQKHALTLLATLAEKDSGVKALIEAQTMPYIMSSLIDSECRHVRCTALTVLHNLLSTPKVSSQKQVLVSIDQFMHSHEEGYSLLDKFAFSSQITRPGFRTDPEHRINRAVEDLCDTLVRQLHKEARLEKDKKGGIQEVHLAPGIDVDPTLLQTLTHVTQVLTQIGNLRTFSVKFNSANTQSLDKEEQRNIMKSTMGRVNASVVRILIDHGVTCLLDILHVYVIKFNFLARSVLPVTGNCDVTSPEQLRSVLQVWETCMKESQTSDVELSSIFSEGEVKLIQALLQAALMLAKSSCDNDIKNIHEEVKDRMEDFERNLCKTDKAYKTENSHHAKEESSEKKVLKISVVNSVSWGEEKSKEDIPINNSCQCNKPGAYSRPKSHVKDFMDRKATIRCPDHKSNDNCLGTLSESGMLFKEALNKELGGARRAVRIMLYEAGIIDSVAPWLICADKLTKEIVIDTLTCLIQPVPDYVQPRPAVPENDMVKKRPMSAMTSKERDKALNSALYQMSSTMSSLIKDALGMEPSTETPRKQVIKPPASKIFTIVEHKHRPHFSSEENGKHSSRSHRSTNDDKNPGVAVTHKPEAWTSASDDDNVFEPESESSNLCTKSPTSCHALSRLTTVSFTDKVNLKSYQREDYDKFARTPVRPQSAKPSQTRPSSAKLAVCKKTRPQSAQVTLTGGAGPSIKKADIEIKKSAHKSLNSNSYKCSEFNAFNPESQVIPKYRKSKTKAPSDSSRFCSTVCANTNAGERLRSSSTSSNKSVTETPKSARLKIQVNARPLSGSEAPIQTNGIKPSSASLRGQSAKSNSSNSSRVSEAKSRKALEELTRKMRTCVPWKPTFDKYETLRGQCCMRVTEVIGMILCRNILHKNAETQRTTITFLQELVKQSEATVHMKLSEFSIIPRLVDYLRINDNKFIEGALGLVLARLLVTSDTRLKNLFNHCGGTRLLTAMVSYAKGFLRDEVVKTLTTLTRGTQSTTVVIAGRRRIQSAPVVGDRCNRPPPDIWDKVMDRWKQEDKVTAILRKKMP